MTIPTKQQLKPNSSTSTAYKHFFLAVFLVLVVSIITTLLIIIFSISWENKKHYEKVSLANIRNLPQVIIKDKVLLANPRQSKCNYWNCFNVYKCGANGHEHDRISIYVYPLKEYIDSRGIPATDTISQEFYAILNTIITSKYYTSDPSKACLFVPSIDLLSQSRFRANITSQALNTLK